MPKTDIYIANQDFVTTIDGKRRKFTRNQSTVRAGHEILRRVPKRFFRLMEVDHDVEQATAAPGEKRRGPGRPRKIRLDDEQDSTSMMSD